MDRKPKESPSNDPEISTEKKNRDRDLGNDDNAEQQQHCLSATDLGDDSEPKNERECGGLGLDSSSSGPQRKLCDTDLEDHSEPKEESESNGSEETDFAGLVSTTQQKLGETDLEDHSEPKKKNKSNGSDERDCAGLVSTTQQKGNMPSRLLRSDRYGVLFEQLLKAKHEKRWSSRAKHLLEAVKKYDTAADKRYNKQVRASEGFHVCQDALIGVCMVPLVKPYDKNGESAHDAARFAVEMYNEKHNPEGKPMELKRVVRATWQELIRRLTIECTDGQFYEAKLLWPFWCRIKCQLIFFRPAKYYPAILCCT